MITRSLRIKEYTAYTGGSRGFKRLSVWRQASNSFKSRQLSVCVLLFVENPRAVAYSAHLYVGVVEKSPPPPLTEE